MFGFATALGFAIAGCASGGKLGGAGNYTELSWRELIPASCVSYFDGCNSCTRNLKTGNTACTPNVCTGYKKPYCLDGTEGISDAPRAPEVLDFQCYNNKHFKLFYGNYTIGDKTVDLLDSQAVFVDGKTRIAEVMTRQPTTEGEKLVSGELVVWLEDGKAIVDKGQKLLYGNCSADSAD